MTMNQFNTYTQSRTEETNTRRNFMSWWTAAGLVHGAGIG
jgi:hypothetical protein